MNRTLRLAVISVCIAAGTLLLVQCSADAPQEPAESVLRRGNLAEPQTLDPHRAEGTPSGTILRDLYEGLVAEAPDGRLVPGTAESWTISDDGLVYTFTLRADARWSNGDPVVAEDFAAGLRRTVDPATASAYAPVLRPIENAPAIMDGTVAPAALGVSAPDDRTLVIRLSQPTPYILRLLTNSPTYPLHRGNFAAHGSDAFRPEHTVSNGPYQMVSWRVGDRLSVERNPHYWNVDNVAIARVEFLPVEDPGTELTLFRAGEIDFTANAPNALYASLRETYGSRFVVAPNLNVYFMAFDLSEPPFDDVRVREAFTIALDREALTASVLASGQTGAWGLVPPGVPDYDGFDYPWREWPRERQLEHARAQYAAAGFDAASPLRARLLYNTSDSHKKVAVALQAMVREHLGAELQVDNQEFKVMLSNRSRRDQWDMMRLGWNGDYNDPNTFLELFREGHPQNTPGYSDAQFDQLLDAAARELDTGRRAELLRSAEARLMQHYAILPVYFYVSKHLVSERIRGFTPNAMNRTYSAHLSLVTSDEP